MVKATVLSPEIFDRSDETVVLSGSPSDLGAQAFFEVVGPLLERLIGPMDFEEKGECLIAFMAAVTGGISAVMGPANAEEMLRIMLDNVSELRSPVEGEH